MTLPRFLERRLYPSPLNGDLMRRTSVSLPTKQVAHDPFEKPDRYADDQRSSTFGKMKESWLAQSQRSRWIKMGTIAFVIISLIYFFSPSGVQVYKGGR